MRIRQSFEEIFFELAVSPQSGQSASPYVPIEIRQFVLNITGKVVHSLKWLSVSKLLAQGIRWIVTFIVIRILLPEDYGLMAMSDVVISFFALFATAGLASALVQVRSFTQIQIQELFGLLLTINLILSIGVYLIAPYAAAFYHEERLIPVLYALLVGFLITAFETLPSALMNREMRFKALSLIDLGAALASALVTLTLALNGVGVWSLVIGYLSEMTFRVVLKFIMQPIKVWPKFSVKESLPLMRFGGMMTMGSMVWFSFVNTDMVIGGRLWPTETLGIYAVAMQISQIPLSKLTPMLKQVAFPAYSNILHQGDQIGPYFLKASGLSMFLTFPVFFGMAATANSYVPLLLGEKWLAVVLPATLIPLTLPFRVAQELIDPAMEARGDPRGVVINWSFALFIVGPSLYIGARYWGLEGLCWAWVSSFPLAFLFSATRACITLDVSLGAYLVTLIRPLTCAAVMFGILHAQFLLIADTFSLALQLGIQIITGTIIYLAMSRLLCATEMRHLFELVKKTRTNTA